jgi:ketosteroid isomerase-like protein
MTPSEIDDVAEQLFRAFEANDADTVASLCDPDATFRQNAGPVVKMAEIIPGFAKLHERIGYHKYVDVQRATFPDGFVEEHRAVSTLPDGKPMDILACVVGRVGPSGKLVELHEYLDTAQRAT